MDDFCFVKTIDRFRERIVVIVARTADGRLDASLTSRSVYRMLTYWDSLSEWCTRPPRRHGRRIGWLLCCAAMTSPLGAIQTGPPMRACTFRATLPRMNDTCNYVKVSADVIIMLLLGMTSFVYGIHRAPIDAKAWRAYRPQK